ncbi:MAG: hypothetical protein C6W55_07410 [Thermobacillus sp.]|nr:MAG: hypothetical protein C6W55_07410 [Thermobacillus sp.]
MSRSTPNSPFSFCCRSSAPPCSCHGSSWRGSIEAWAAWFMARTQPSRGVVCRMVGIAENLKLNDRLHLDVQYETLIKDGIILSLSKIEFRILYCLTMNRNRIVSFDKLIDFAWKWSSTVTRRELYVYITRLRKKLDDNLKIICVRNRGYMMTE